MSKKVNLALLISSILVVAMVVIIFAFSTQQGKNSVGISGNIVDYLIQRLGLSEFIGGNELIYDNRNKIFRKILHFIEYAILASLMINLLSLLKSLKLVRIRTRHIMVVTVLFAFIVASADEFYQSHIPGRTPRIQDVLIDTSGAIFAILIILLCKKTFCKFKKDGAI